MYIHMYIHIFIHTYIDTYVHHCHCFQNKFKHLCSSTSFFLKVKLWKLVMKCKCFMEGIQEI